MVAVGSQDVEAFKAGFSGVTLTPGDNDYDGVRAVWNGWFDKRPAVIARCRTDRVPSYKLFRRLRLCRCLRAALGGILRGTNNSRCC